ncbi:methyltransferase domain-containing protein [Candidatus Thorarchaeota archaeon]|nr:MAG: methyltransferase domain-containing protein [Candidatus Thorarchaeota archaeon]
MPRLDAWLVDTGRYSSRQLAKRAIKEGIVIVNGKYCKPSTCITGKEEIKILSESFNKPMGYHKLRMIDELLGGTLIQLPCLALDIGSSAGGFLQYLQHKGAQVIGIEVSKRFSQILNELAATYSEISFILTDAFTIEPTSILTKGQIDLLLVDVTTDKGGTLNLISRFRVLLRKGSRLVAAFKIKNDPGIVLQVIKSVKSLGFDQITNFTLDDARQEVHIVAHFM